MTLSNNSFNHMVSIPETNRVRIMVIPTKRVNGYGPDTGRVGYD